MLAQNVYQIDHKSIIILLFLMSVNVLFIYSEKCFRKSVAWTKGREPIFFFFEKGPQIHTCHDHHTKDH